MATIRVLRKGMVYLSHNRKNRRSPSTSPGKPPRHMVKLPWMSGVLVDGLWASSLLSFSGDGCCVLIAEP